MASTSLIFCAKPGTRRTGCVLGGANMLTGWSRVALHGKAVDVFDPPGLAQPRGVVLYLHSVGGESLAEEAVYTAALARHGFACAAPQTMRSWWVDHVCEEFDVSLTAERFLLDTVVPWIRERWNWGTRPLATVGISMGGQGAVRLGFRHPQVFPIVGSVAGAFDFHEWYGQGSPLDTMYTHREQARLDTAILQIRPSHYPPHIWFACDPDDTEWYRGNDRLHEKLTAYGLPHTADLETTAGGHDWSYFQHMAEPLFAFVATAVQQEGRRLL
ncbi:MAG: esterase family protein [Bacteroidales bacterium]|nr:esterase family protein [Bacteroidales bacterium]